MNPGHMPCNHSASELHPPSPGPFKNWVLDFPVVECEDFSVCLDKNLPSDMTFANILSLFVISFS